MGLAALARKNGMSLKELTALNGIKENYKPQKGEYFLCISAKTKKSRPEKLQKKFSRIVHLKLNLKRNKTCCNKVERK